MDKLSKNNLFFMRLLKINKLIKNLMLQKFNKINLEKICIYLKV